MRLLSHFHARGVDACFGRSASPDAKNSAVTPLLEPGRTGLAGSGLYLTDRFSKQREAYADDVAKMLGFLGEDPATAKAHAGTVLEIETALAKASKSPVNCVTPSPITTNCPLPNGWRSFPT